MTLPAARDQPAFILHRRAFRETSVIVELLTRDFGRVAGVVRGAKGGGRQRYSIEPFTRVDVAWRGRGQMVTVLNSEAIAAARLTGDALFAGLYLNELLVKTLEPQEPVETLFHRYGVTLAALASDDALEPALRCFEKGLLDELGYGLVFDVDIRSGTPIELDRIYRFVDGEGFRQASDSGDRPASATSDPQTLTGAEITAIANEDFARPAVRSAAKLVFRRALQKRLAGKRLNTRRLFTGRSAGQVND